MAFEMSPIGKKKCSYSPMQKKGLISPMLKEGEEPKSRVGQAVENFKTRNELTSYTKGDPDKPTVVVTTKKKARKDFELLSKKLGFTFYSSLTPNIFGPFCKPFYNS